MNPIIIERLMAIADFYGVTYTNLFNRSKKRSIIQIRHTIYYYFVEQKYSLELLAMFFKRHKNTITYAYKKIKKKPNLTIYKNIKAIIGV